MRISSQRGSALMSALFILAIITIVVVLILSLDLFQVKMFRKDNNRLQAIYNAESAVNQLLASGEKVKISTGEPNRVKLDWGDEADVSFQTFGALIGFESIGYCKTSKQSISGYIGNKELDVMENALAVYNSSTDLSLTGDFSINGDMLLNRRYAKKSLKGIGFKGHVNSVVKKLTTDFPDIDFSQLDDFKSKLVRDFRAPTDGVKNHALWGRKIFSTSNDITLNSRSSHKSEQAGIIITTGKLVIEGSYRCTSGCIYMAEEIVLQDEIEGNYNIFYATKSLIVKDEVNLSAQLISEGTITIEDKAVLVYPSLVLATREKTSKTPAQLIHLKGESQVNGSVIFFDKSTRVNNRVRDILIEDTATVNGLVLCNSLLEMGGIVQGSVITANAGFYESPAYYVNWIRAGAINRPERMNSLTLPAMFSDSPGMEILTLRKSDNPVKKAADE